jgi:hypothetical protein
MAFCSTCCMKCGEESSLVPVNYSGFHKVCPKHYASVKERIKDECQHCRSVVILVPFELLQTKIQDSTLPSDSSNSTTSIQSNLDPSMNVCNCELFSINCSTCMKKFCSNCERSLKESALCRICCPECKKAAEIRSQEYCLHSLCGKCSHSLECFECISNKYFCNNCDLVSNKVTLSCGHDGCLSCLPNKNCKICEPKQCKNCNSECKSLMAFECGHMGCELCKSTYCLVCQPAPQCSVCKSYQSEVIRACGHKGCSECSVEQYCSYCLRENTKCEMCEINRSGLKMQDCSHKRCSECLTKTCEVCHKNEQGKPQAKMRVQKSCIFFSSVYSERIKLNRKHFNSTTCLPTSKKIKTHKQKSNKSHCAACNSESKIIELACGHSICDPCFDLYKQCVSCYKCSVCNFYLSSRDAKCGHQVCPQCLDRLNNCKSCSIDKTKEKKCPNCGNICNRLTEMTCGDYGCALCSHSQPCFRCFKQKRDVYISHKDSKQCAICSEFIDKYGILLCEHVVCLQCLELPIENLNYLCSKCVVEEPKKQMCRNCQRVAEWADVSQKLLVKLCCGKYYCKNCLKNIQSEDHECKKCIIF